MADIYGRSVSRWQPGVTFEMVKKLIRDGIAKISGAEMKKTVNESITETLNLTEVEPDEIVVFAERQTGKLKTSNFSINDILKRQRGVAGSLALYTAEGDLKPSSLLETDILKCNTEQKTRFDNHVREFNSHVNEYNGRRSVIDSFFWT